MSGVAGRSGPPGNDNAKRGRLWRDALERALAKRGGGDKVAALDELAEKFLDAVLDMTKSTEKRGPSIAGFQEIADRLDGRPAQALEHSGPDGEPLIPPTIIVNPVKAKE